VDYREGRTMIQLLKTKRTPSTILGLAFDAGRLEGVVVRRSNGSLQVQKTFSVPLALNPLTGDPELVGRELRNHLDQNGIRERRCVVGLPLSWALTVQTKVPDLPDADLASFLEIEAERGFPYGPETLAVCHSLYRPAGGERTATLVAIPRNHLAQLEKGLRAAQLRPVSFTLGIAALQNADTESSQGVMALAIGESSVDLQLTFGGGIVALRSLDGSSEADGVQKRPYADLVAREIRITLGQLPAELRGALRKIRLFGRGEFAQRFAADITLRSEAMGLKVELVKDYPPDEFTSHYPAGTKVAAALSLAARHLTAGRPRLEFLPPKTSSWQQLTTRFSSKKLAWAGAIAGSAALLVAGAFLIQQWQLSRYQSRWSAMGPKVKELDDMQQQIKKFRPWFDDSFRSLSILRKLTEAFPEDGVVSARSFEIRELSAVSCSGVARDNQAFLKMLDHVRATKQVGNLKVDQVRGKTPLQFTFNFQWGEGGRNEN
jgi:hypothetical protein